MALRILGNTDIETTTTNLTDWFLGSGFDCTETFNVERLYFYAAAGTSTANVYAAVYEETSLNNYTLRFSTGTRFVVANTTPQWWSIDINGVVQSGKRYGLFIWSPQDLINYSDFFAANVTYGTTGNTAPNWPSPEFGGTVDDKRLSIYVEGVVLSEKKLYIKQRRPALFKPGNSR
jgi:hypothetical protein